AREVRPVRAELKFHRNSGDHADHEVDSKNAGPETRSLDVALVVCAQSQGLESHDQGRQPHGQLGKQVVKCDSKAKVQTMNQQCAIHTDGLAAWARTTSMPGPLTR